MVIFCSLNIIIIADLKFLSSKFNIYLPHRFFFPIFGLYFLVCRMSHNLLLKTGHFVLFTMAILEIGFSSLLHGYLFLLFVSDSLD